MDISLRVITLSYALQAHQIIRYERVNSPWSGSNYILIVPLQWLQHYVLYVINTRVHIFKIKSNNT